MSRDVRYIVSIAVLAPVPDLEISEDEYLSLARARTILSGALAIEERYEILIANYLTFENALLTIAAANAVRDKRNYEEFFDARLSLNTCLVNILTAARLYIDQLPQNAAECLPDRIDVIDQVKAKCSEEYDSHFEFRFMEALRNHVQHRGIPIHFTRQGARWIGDGEERMMEFTVDIFAQREVLERDDKFKKSVLSEIADDIDLKAASRSYLESLSTIHELARVAVADAVNQARATIKAVHERYRVIYSDNLVGLTAFAMEDGEASSSIPLLLDWDDVRIQLQKRNPRLVKLARRYVSGRRAVQK
jgi:hypothetical protein